MNTRSRTVLSATGLAAVASFAMAAATAVVGPEFGGDPYPLDTCPVSGEKLGAEAVTVVLSGMSDKTLDGTQVRFCCPKCEASFKAEPAKCVGKMNEAIQRSAPAYPLKGCIVMKDEELEDDAKIVVWQNRVYKLCCGKCVNKFKADPARFAKEYEAQVAAAQKPGYKATTCPISGKPLGDGAVDVVVNARLVRTCCPGCVGAVKADPKAAFAKVDGK
jgi:hypothetical protein